MNAPLSHGACRAAARSHRRWTLSGILPPYAEEAATARKKFPSSASPIPTEQIRRYFQVASRERWCRWK